MRRKESVASMLITSLDRVCSAEMRWGWLERRRGVRSEVACCKVLRWLVTYSARTHESPATAAGVLRIRSYEESFLGARNGTKTISPQRRQWTKTISPERRQWTTPKPREYEDQYNQGPRNWQNTFRVCCPCAIVLYLYNIARMTNRGASQMRSHMATPDP